MNSCSNVAIDKREQTYWQVNKHIKPSTKHQQGTFSNLSITYSIIFVYKFEQILGNKILNSFVFSTSSFYSLLFLNFRRMVTVVLDD